MTSINLTFNIGGDPPRLITNSRDVTRSHVTSRIPRRIPRPPPPLDLSGICQTCRICKGNSFLKIPTTYHQWVRRRQICHLPRRLVHRKWSDKIFELDKKCNLFVSVGRDLQKGGESQRWEAPAVSTGLRGIEAGPGGDETGIREEDRGTCGGEGEGGFRGSVFMTTHFPKFTY